MKRIYTTIIASIFISVTVNAQLTLTKAFNEPIIGDAYVNKGFDTVNTVPKNVGANQIWNFSAFTQNTVTSSGTFTSASSVATASNYAGCNLVEDQGSNNYLFEKTASNAQEVNARAGKIIFISDKEGISHFSKMAKKTIEIPKISGIIEEALLPVISTQLLSYFVALYKGNDVDQPRNLAKSVTVE